MNVNDSLYTEAVKRKNAIELILCRLRKDLSTAPEGTLRITRNRKSFQYYHRHSSQDPQGIYIKREDDPLAAALAQKDYDTKLLISLEKQLKAIDRFLKDFDPGAPLNAYEDLAEPRKQLVTPVFVGDADYVEQWLGVPYEKMGFKPDDPVFYTDRGEHVRSKSEVLIANELYRHGIPYRYEYPVYCGGVLMAAPDFNCLNIRLRKEYYWEHLGMMGKEEYANRNAAKIEKYTLAKDFDETSLILTFETDRHPLNTRVIEEKIRKYLV